MMRPALTIFVSLCIAGCGGGSSSSDQTPSQDEQAATRQVKFEFVNTTDDATDFFLKDASNEASLFDESNKVVMNSEKAINQHTVSWSTPTPLTVDIGALETNSLSEIGKIEDLVTNTGESYWLIAWEDTELGETLFVAERHEKLDNEDQYGIRIFSLQDIEINIIKPTTGVMSNSQIKKGQISEQKILGSCIGELFMNNQATIDFCGDGVTPGKSYLLVIDEESVLFAAEEK
ncbi:hypothetical protein MD588_03440 [Photobacterium sp. SDRW27]|uniref:hypothetical protein n=1 Tax=Photobacterium obscurum TaxID=2829490 RepID=UPI0022436703|nr:hypothetical protein [Photobacterium obscurum]MCW8327851.1 hypothetical protein [Photobacterium obscurum]